MQHWWLYILAAMAVGTLISNLLSWALDMKGHRARRRRNQAVHRAKEWAGAVLESEGDTWSPSPVARSSEADPPAV